MKWTEEMKESWNEKKNERRKESWNEKKIQLKSEAHNSVRHPSKVCNILGMLGIWFSLVKLSGMKAFISLMFMRTFLLLYYD